MDLFSSLFHVTIYCNDIDKTLDFYNKLGLKFIFKIGEEGEIPWNYYLKIAAGQYIEIQPVHSSNPHPIPETAVYRPDQTIWHFALETPDIKNMIEVLLSRGLELWYDGDKSKPVTDPEGYMEGPDGCKICWIFDPDGTPIELMEQSETSMQYIYDPESYMKFANV